MLFRRCPSSERLERFIRDPDAEPRVARHVERCEKCRAALAEAREDAELLAQLRAAAGGDVGEERRRRIVEICRRALDESGMSAARGEPPADSAASPP